MLHVEYYTWKTFTAKLHKYQLPDEYYQLFRLSK